MLLKEMYSVERATNRRRNQETNSRIKKSTPARHQFASALDRKPCLLKFKTFLFMQSFGVFTSGSLSHRTSHHIHHASIKTPREEAAQKGRFP
jgi:hypothetical protein